MSISSIRQAIVESIQQGRKKHVTEVSGYSGDSLIGFLQRALGQYHSGTYLEVGVYRGLTLINVAAANPQAQVFGIDNFSQFDTNGDNERTVRNAMGALKLQNVDLINADFEDALLSLERRLGGRKIDVYFVDGPHDYRSQYLCLEFAKKHLADNAVIVVDDCNYDWVRQANKDWLLTNPEFTLMFEAYTGAHPLGMSEADQQQARKSWWDGVNIMVRDHQHQLERTYPAVSGDRTLYFDEHVVFSNRYAYEAPKILDAFTMLRQGPVAMLKGIKRLAGVAVKSEAVTTRAAKMNTTTHALPKERFAAPAKSAGAKVLAAV